MTTSLLCLLLLVLPLAPVQRGGGGGGGGTPAQLGRDMYPDEKFADVLRIEEKQAPEVQKVFNAAAAEAVPVSDEMIKARRQLVTLEAEGKSGETAAAVAAYKAGAAKMTGIELRAFQKIFAVLKNNQRAKSVEAFTAMAGIFNPKTPRPPRPAPTPGTPGSGAGAGTGGGNAARAGGGSRNQLSRMDIFETQFALTDEQKKQVKAIMDADYKGADALRKQMAKSRDAAGALIKDAKPQDQIDAALKVYADQTVEMAHAETKTLARILQTLTPEQRANEAAVTAAVFMMRGAFVYKKWDIVPDIYFY